MDVTTAQLYDLLVDKGFERDKVREALSDIMTKREAEKTLVTKEDLKENLERTTRWIIGVFIVIAFGQLAITGMMVNSAVSAITASF